MTVHSVACIMSIIQILLKKREL